MTPLHLVDDEAEATWRTGSLDDVLALVPHRPAVLAVDGRGAAGKSTLAARLAARVPGAQVLHCDDLAWHEPFFGWGHLLVACLEPLRRGEQVHLVPPMWPAKGRDGAIEIAADCPLLVVEGTGAAQRAAAHLVDAVVWVQGDFAEQERRGIARDIEQGVNGDETQTVAFWHEWMGHERAHFADDRPWERADLVVCGTPELALPASTLPVGALLVGWPHQAVPATFCRAGVALVAGRDRKSSR